MTLEQLAAESQTPAVETPVQSPVDDDFVRIPRDQIGPGGWHETARQAKAYGSLENDGWVDFAQKSGLSGRQLSEYWDTPSESAQPPVEPDQASNQLTADAIGQIVAEKLKRFREESDRNHEQQLEQADRSKRFDAERQFASETLKALKLEPEIDGKPNDRFLDAEAMFNRRLNAVIKSDIPEHWSKDRRDKAFSSPATDEQLKRAADTFGGAMKDWMNEAIASDATRTATEPATTLAGGPDGGEPPKDLDRMTMQEIADKILPGR